ncbi:MAG: single-stranded-DNA-specific exonuclease RecJ [Clostridiales bacterium]|nr:single-stranded-DNA-specific exonuclease RecJ [Clostridiales bacterium]
MICKKWVLQQYDKQAASGLFASGHFSKLLSILLAQRGISEPEQAVQYINCEDAFCDPFSIRDMHKAVDRIEAAIDSFEKIAVYGDYDADGVTATSLLYSYLCERGADVLFYIPEREGEGYGMHQESVQWLKEQGVTLIITVDNGIAAVEEVRFAASLGVDVVVTDHHKPGEILPDAVAVIDPHREDETCDFHDYAGVGVAFKLVQALEGGEPDALLEQYADLVALGTIADVVELHGENRALVKRGLSYLTQSDRPGIQALVEQSGMSGKKLTGMNVAFSLAPRINAAGRMGSPGRAVRLLLAEEEAEAVSLAEEICEENRRRQQLEKDVLAQIDRMIAEHPEWVIDRVIVLGGDGWHRGVIGIAAARVMEKYGRPCILLSVENGEARGSGRSLPGFSLYDAIQSGEEYLEGFGGHELAAGVSLKAEKIDAFRRAVNGWAAKQYPRMPVPQISLSCKLKPDSLQLSKIADVHYLEPFGSGNPAPVYGLFRMRLDRIQSIGGGGHVRLMLSRDRVPVTAVWFGMTKDAVPCREGELVDLAVTLGKSEYRGEETLSIFIKDLHPSDFSEDAYIDGIRAYEAHLRLEEQDEDVRQSLLPGREELAVVWRGLRASGGFQSSFFALAHQYGAVGSGKLLIALDVLAEMGLIDYDRCRLTEGNLQIRMIPTKGKVNLNDSAVLQGLAGNSHIA